MSKVRTFVLDDSPLNRSALMQLIREAPAGYHVTLGEEPRTTEQNRLMWAYLDGFEATQTYKINTVDTKLTSEEWKTVLTAMYYLETHHGKLAALPGGVVVLLGSSTSKFGKEEFSPWLDFLMATAADYGVEPVFKSSHKK